MDPAGCCSSIMTVLKAKTVLKATSTKPRFENTTALHNALPLYFNHNGMNEAEVFIIADP